MSQAAFSADKRLDIEQIAVTNNVVELRFPVSLEPQKNYRVIVAALDPTRLSGVTLTNLSFRAYDALGRSLNIQEKEHGRVLIEKFPASSAYFKLLSETDSYVPTLSVTAPQGYPGRYVVTLPAPPEGNLTSFYTYDGTTFIDSGYRSNVRTGPVTFSVPVSEAHRERPIHFIALRAD